MGQYYKPVSLTSGEHLSSHDYDNGLKIMEHSWIPNNFVRTVEGLLARGGLWFGHRIVWAGDYADHEKGKNENIYELAKDELKIKPPQNLKYYRYLINHTKKQYVDKKDGVVRSSWQIHPLPLLTCEGHGRGGGDFRGDPVHKEDDPIIGSWARDVIEPSTEKPGNKYQKIFFLLFEIM